MTILAVDQTYNGCSLAVKNHDGRIVSKYIDLDPKRLTSTLTRNFIGEIQALCPDMATLCVIASTVGPASFTGLRVVLASLQGIAFAAHAKVFTCTRLALQAYQAFDHDPNLLCYQSCLSNQRDYFFIQRFERVFSQGSQEKLDATPQDKKLFEDKRMGMEKNFHWQPKAETDVELIDAPPTHSLSEADTEKDTALSLLKWSGDVFPATFGTYADLRPFYGHDPVFKKKIV